MIVTIDGPAGAGKSTAARALADRLGFEYLDTGAMYRAVTLAAMRGGIDAQQDSAVAHLLENLRIELPPGRVVLNGEDIAHLIRTKEITAASGPIADNPAVRRRLVDLQREVAAARDMVCEGRDQGTIVFPNAACKFFLIADADVRARRRQQEMAARGDMVSVEEVRAGTRRRDRRDAERDIAPMVPAADAVMIDSTHLDLDEVVSLMEQRVRQCRLGSPNCGTPPPSG